MVDLREYDVPFHVRYAIDNDIRAGHWYTVSAKVQTPVTPPRIATSALSVLNHARASQQPTNRPVAGDAVGLPLHNPDPASLCLPSHVLPPFPCHWRRGRVATHLTISCPLSWVPNPWTCC